MGYVQYNYDAGTSLQWYEFTVVPVDFGTSWLYNILLFLNHRYRIFSVIGSCIFTPNRRYLSLSVGSPKCNYVGFASFSKQYLHIITHCIKNRSYGKREVSSVWCENARTNDGENPEITIPKSEVWIWKCEVRSLKIPLAFRKNVIFVLC
jgi:hypothetical protein